MDSPLAPSSGNTCTHLLYVENALLGPLPLSAVVVCVITRCVLPLITFQAWEAAYHYAI